MNNLWLGYFLGLGTLPCLLLLTIIWWFLGCLFWSIKWTLFEYRVLKLAMVTCPEYADSKKVFYSKIWKRLKNELKTTLRWGKPDNNYNNNTLEDKAGNIYEYRGWKKPRVIRRKGTPQENSVSSPKPLPLPVPSKTRSVTKDDGIKMFVDN